MQPKQLQRIFELIKKTGDRLIVVDGNSGQSFAVMNIDDYELLVDDNCECFDQVLDDNGDSDDFYPEEFEKEIPDLSEQEMLQKINNDIALWRDAQKKKNDEELIEEILEDNSVSEIEPIKDISVENDAPADDKSIKPIFSSLGDVLADDKYLNRQFDDSPRIKTLEEEDLSDVEHTEEKFYLEPVE
jgi:hypothetical protein